MIKRLALIFICFLLMTFLIGCSQQLSPDETLKSYFEASINNDYKKMASLFGGTVQYFEEYEGSLKPTLEEQLKEYLELIGGIPAEVKEILNKDQVTETEYVFEVTLVDKDGIELHVNHVHSPKTFTYTVREINGTYKVIELPPYSP